MNVPDEGNNGEKHFRYNEIYINLHFSNQNLHYISHQKKSGSLSVLSSYSWQEDNMTYRISEII